MNKQLFVKDKTMEMDNIIGKEVSVNEGQVNLAENIFTYKSALDRLFKRLAEEHRDSIVKEFQMWNDIIAIAKSQFPEFDEGKYQVSWDFAKRKFYIVSKKQIEGELL